MLSRRAFLLLLMTCLAAGTMVVVSDVARAKDDDGGGNSGHGGGGDDGDDDNSGHGGGDDDGDDDNSGHGGGGDDDKDDDDRDNDKNKIRSAVKRGEAESLGSILPAVRRKYPGKVVRIQLAGKGTRLTYRIRMIGRDNKLFEVRVNARSGRIMGAYNL
jgi:hypothetical protein